MTIYEEKELYHYMMSRISYIVKEKLNYNTELLTESKNFKKAKILLDNDELFDGDSSDFIKNVIIPTLPVLRTKEGSKFIVGVVRIYIEEGLTIPELKGNKPDKFFIQFNKILEFITKYEYDDYSRNLNDLYVGQLFFKYLPIISDAHTKEKYILSTKAKHLIRNKDYIIIPIQSFRHAQKYAEYNNWCTSLRLDDYKAYTRRNTNQLYYCLRNDYKDVERKQTEDYPNDDYGLSMIWIVIGPDGEFLSTTTRWNDIKQTLTPEDIQNLLGVDFYNTFTPNINYMLSI